MFTGIIEEIGKIKKISPLPYGKKISVIANFSEQLKTGDSIAINGVCQTVVSKGKRIFQTEALGETINKTTIKYMSPGTHVNLERALRADNRFDGHIVQGHVNGTGKIKKIINRGHGYLLVIEIPDKYKDEIVPEGSIAIDGISLTIAKINNNIISINLIHHTFEQSIIKYLKNGAIINFETDILIRNQKNILTNQDIKSISLIQLREWGY